MSGPGREVRAASTIVRPNNPTRRPPSVSSVSDEALAERPARAPVDDVGREPSKLRLLHPLDEHRRPEVELVIAERREVQARGIQRGDHLRALKERRLDRRRQEIARDDEHRVRILALDFSDERRQPRHPAPPAAVHRPEDIVVVDLQEGQPNEIPIRDRRAPRGAAAEDDREDDQERGERRA